MTDAMFTPGPWRLWKADEKRWEICEPDKEWRHSHFCTVQVGNCWLADGPFNAHLIVASPDLYAAAQQLLTDYIKLLMSQGWDERDVASLQVVKDANAALSKARGET